MTTSVPVQPIIPLTRALAIEVLGGLLGAVVVGAIAGVGIGLLFQATGWALQLGMGMLLVMVYAAVYAAVGAAAGVALAGRALRQGGSFWLALAGSIIGALPIVVLARVGWLGNFWISVWFALAGALALAVAGYNLRRVQT